MHQYNKWLDGSTKLVWITETTSTSTRNDIAIEQNSTSIPRATIATTTTTTISNDPPPTTVVLLDEGIIFNSTYDDADLHDNDGCWRRCQSRPNVIVLQKGGRPEGLNHQLKILHSLLNIAGYLCATLYVPRPSAMLSDNHNFRKHKSKKKRQSVDPDSQWTDYYHFTWADMTISDKQPQPGPSTRKISPALVERRNQSIIIPNNFRFHVETTDKGQGWNHLALLDNLTMSQQHKLLSSDHKARFLWSIQCDFHAMNKHMNIPPERIENLSPSFPNQVPFGRTGCTYFQQAPSIHISKVGNAIWKHILPQEGASTMTPVSSTTPNATATATVTATTVDISRFRRTPSSDNNNTAAAFTDSLVGFWHIRRHDATWSCDTSIKRMTAFVDCSFQESHLLQKNITLLIMTDEHSTNYLSDLLRLFDAYPHVKVFHLDPLAQYHLKNYVLDNTTKFEEHPKKGATTAGGNYTGGDKKRLYNNYILFAILTELQSIAPSASFFLEHRRHFSCPNCTKLHEIL